MPNQVLGDRWQIIEPLGEGGQGHIYKVQDIKDGNKIYVLKRLKNTKRIERFKIEIETVEKLNHPNIVKLIDYDLKADKPYFVSEYCSGGELSFDKISHLSILEKLSLFLIICRAVEYANQEKQVIHRDIKPANILLREDNQTPIISDFGICFNTDEGLERLTELAEAVGARFYMAPELADGRTEEIKSESDSYSLGKLLYWMLSGKIFDREKFEDAKWDLRDNQSSNHEMNFIYDLIFKKAIVESPRDRLPVWMIRGNVEKVIEIIKQNGRYLDTNVRQRCLFCAVGQYEYKFLDSASTNYKNSTNFGLAYGSMSIDTRIQPLDKYPKVMFLVCTNCGNTQTFRIDLAKEDAWKGISFEKR